MAPLKRHSITNKLLEALKERVSACDSRYRSLPAADCAEASKHKVRAERETAGTGKCDRRRDGARSQSAATKSLLRRRRFLTPILQSLSVVARQEAPGESQAVKNGNKRGDGARR